MLKVAGQSGIEKYQSINQSINQTTTNFSTVAAMIKAAGQSDSEKSIN